MSGGMIHWDLLNEEGLEIAAGMYLYHVKPNFLDQRLNQFEHVGKFAVIKWNFYFCSIFTFLVSA